MTKTFPGYLDAFLALERMAPETDHPFVKMVTQHEAVVLQFLDRIAAGTANPSEPLVSYICTPHPEPLAA